MMQAAGAEAFAVAGARAHDQRQIARGFGFDKAFLERGMERFRDAALHEPGRANDVAVADQRDGFIGRHDFVLHGGVSPGSATLWRRRREAAVAAGWPLFLSVPQDAGRRHAQLPYAWPLRPRTTHRGKRRPIHGLAVAVYAESGGQQFIPQGQLPLLHCISALRSSGYAADAAWPSKASCRVPVCMQAFASPSAPAKLPHTDLMIQGPPNHARRPAHS